MFIDKEKIIQDAFVTQNKKGDWIVKPNLYKFLHEKDNIQIVMDYSGYDIKYLDDDQLHKRYPDELPDNIDGNVCVFLHLPDVIKIAESYRNEMLKEQEKERNERQKDFEMTYGR